jgi:hypothetical protein
MPEYIADTSTREPLRFDFTDAGGPKGTIPEPSAETAAALQDAFNTGSVREQTEALVAFCGGAITLRDLERLPLREARGFLRWLWTEVAVKAAPPVRIAGVTLEREQPVVDDVVPALGRPVVDALGLDGDELREYCTIPLSRAVHEGAHWAQRELLAQLAAVGIAVEVRTPDDIARELLAQLDAPEG